MAWRTVTRSNGRTALRLTTLLTAFGVALAIAVVPGIASAADPVGMTFDAADRSMEPGIDTQMIVWVTVFSVLALFAVAGIGYLYRRERGLDWEFQKPDIPHDEHH
ncbi:MAG: hypothetical protein DWG82_01630 [Chloroflexi bacterium]|nr:hypothetical protein [Chloroflexota bacterium]